MKRGREQSSVPAGKVLAVTRIRMAVLDQADRLIPARPAYPSSSRRAGSLLDVCRALITG
jgi:hypothetical protein